MKHELRSHATNRFRRHLRNVWASRGGGFYGFVAMLTFVYLEGIDLAGDFAALPASFEPELGFVIGWIVGNFVDAIVNGVRAAIWPVSWIRHFGVGILSGVLLAGCYGAYRLLRPTVLRLLTLPGEDPAALEPLIAKARVGRE
ncbi:MAG TPA: hypothetical protein VK939_17275 [Longimicrobiales bacterium]|nr:hypothetical protein [Longimicrobiales bacterium]